VSCPYCSAKPEDAWIITDDVIAAPHPVPITVFHVTVAPRRHVPTFYDLDVSEQRHIWDVLSVLRERINATLPVQGFDIGFVDGAQDDTESHTFVHLVPRVGGVRTRLPANADWVDLGA
jgi:diadenosine tetraphosphate (Ap4A) HIT family hydrolase